MYILNHAPHWGKRSGVPPSWKWVWKALVRTMCAKPEQSRCHNRLALMQNTTTQHLQDWYGLFSMVTEIGHIKANGDLWTCIDPWKANRVRAPLHGPHFWQERIIAWFEKRYKQLHEYQSQPILLISNDSWAWPTAWRDGPFQEARFYFGETAPVVPAAT